MDIVKGLKYLLTFILIILIVVLIIWGACLIKSFFTEGFKEKYENTPGFKIYFRSTNIVQNPTGVTLHYRPGNSTGAYGHTGMSPISPDLTATWGPNWYSAFITSDSNNIEDSIQFYVTVEDNTGATTIIKQCKNNGNAFNLSRNTGETVVVGELKSINVGVDIFKTILTRAVEVVDGNCTTCGCPTGTCGGGTGPCGETCPEKDCGNGSCSNGVCNCAPGYSGANCEICTPDCEGKVCGNDSRCGVSCGDCSGNGSCSNGVCNCASGYTGANCENAPGPCYGIDCGNGNCIDGFCKCDTGYTGANCESCAPGYTRNDSGVCEQTTTGCGVNKVCVCKPGYVKVVTDGVVTCECPIGYTGANCSSCASGYEKVNGVCVPTCGSNEIRDSSGACVPCEECGSKNCGTTNCGVSCGTCPDGQTCVGGVCTVANMVNIYVPDGSVQEPVLLHYNPGPTDTGSGWIDKQLVNNGNGYLYISQPIPEGISELEFGFKVGPNKNWYSPGYNYRLSSGNYSIIPGQVGEVCGSCAADQCGGTTNCGESCVNECSIGYSCVNNKCVCNKTCDGVSCGGLDGCGGTCGCGSGQECINGECVTCDECSTSLECGDTETTNCGKTCTGTYCDSGICANGVCEEITAEPYESGVMIQTFPWFNAEYMSQRRFYSDMKKYADNGSFKKYQIIWFPPPSYSTANCTQTAIPDAGDGHLYSSQGYLPSQWKNLWSCYGNGPSIRDNTGSFQPETALDMVNSHGQGATELRGAINALKLQNPSTIPIADIVINHVEGGWVLKEQKLYRNSAFTKENYTNPSGLIDTRKKYFVAEQDNSYYPTAEKPGINGITQVYDAALASTNGLQTPYNACNSGNAYICFEASNLSDKGPLDGEDDGPWGLDLAHSSTDVQAAVIDYLKTLHDVGFDGWRYDFTKGYLNGYISNIYNRNSYAKFSVMELWDGKDNIIAGIDDSIRAIGKEPNNIKNFTQEEFRLIPRAFDFPLMYTLRDIVDNGDWEDLKDDIKKTLLGDDVYRRFSVGFLVNHDTYRHKENRFPDKHIESGYLILLTHPGTPSVYILHDNTFADINAGTISSNDPGNTEWITNRCTDCNGPYTNDQRTTFIHDLISIREECGIREDSIFCSENGEDPGENTNGNFYASIITGNKKSIAVVIGKGYYNWNPSIRAYCNTTIGNWTERKSGNLEGYGYTVWTSDSPIIW